MHLPMNDAHLRDLDLNLLTVFDAVLRERGVTKAADALGMTQSALSHALNRLRDYFHDPLFVKGAAGMVPTRKAEALREPVVQVMAVLRQQILSESRFDPATSDRVFTLCMTDMGELVFLPPLVDQFREHAPACRIRSLQVPIEQIESLLASGDADLALGSIRSAPEGLFRQRLFMHPFVTIVSTRNRSVGQRLTMKQFERMPHVAVSLTGKPGGNYDSILDEQGVQRNVFLTTPHFLAVPLLLDRHPELIATVPARLGEVFEKYGTVRCLQPPVAVPPFALNQHWHSRFHHDPAIVWLRELIKRTFENYPEIPAARGTATPRRRLRA
jgi:DNA-binding transcriptional LysR family regulator